MPLGKLVKTIRTINIYKKTKSRFLGKSIDEINIDAIPLEVLKSIITPNNDDPMLYDGYNLSPEELEKLYALTESKISPDHKKFDYTLETYGIYEKDE